MSNPLRKKDEENQVIETFHADDGHSYRRIKNSVTGDVRWEVLNTWTEQAKWMMVKDHQERTMSINDLEMAYSNNPPSTLDPEDIETGGAEKIEFFRIRGHRGEFRRRVTINGNVEFEVRMVLTSGNYRHVNNRDDVEYSEAEIKDAWRKR